MGGWRPLQYPQFFFAGYLIASHERLQRRIAQTRWVGSGLILCLMALYKYAVHRATALRTLSGLKPPRRAKLSSSQVPVVQPAT